LTIYGEEVLITMHDRDSDKQYIARIHDINPLTTFHQIKIYDADPIVETEPTYIASLNSVKYYENFAPIVLLNGYGYKLFEEELWRELSVMYENPTFLGTVDKRFFFAYTESFQFVSEYGHLVESSLEGLEGLPPEKVFAGGDIEKGNVQIKGNASGEKAISIDSDIVAGNNTVTIGNSSIPNLWLGNLEFSVTDEKLIISTTGITGKTFDFLWKESAGPL
jgi:hypothetical protein